MKAHLEQAAFRSCCSFPKTGLIWSGILPGAVLRLCRPGYHTKDELQAEIEWLSALSRDMSSRSLKLPVPVADGDGGYVQSVDAEDGLV